MHAQYALTPTQAPTVEMQIHAILVLARGLAWYARRARTVFIPHLPIPPPTYLLNPGVDDRVRIVDAMHEESTQGAVLEMNLGSGKVETDAPAFVTSACGNDHAPADCAGAASIRRKKRKERVKDKTKREQKEKKKKEKKKKKGGKEYMKRKKDKKKKKKKKNKKEKKKKKKKKNKKKEEEEEQEEEEQEKEEE